MEIDRPPPKLPRLMPWAFVAIGCAISMPAVSFTAPRKYFLYKLRTIESLDDRNNVTLLATLPNGTSSHQSLNDLQQQYESWTVIVMNLGALLFNVISVLIASKFPFGTRLLASLTSCFLLLVPAIILALVDTDEMQEAFFAITMATIFLLMGSATMAFSSFISFSGTISRDILQVTMLSVAIGAIVVSLLNIISLLVGDENQELTAIYYFGSTAFLLLTAIILAAVILQHHSIQYYANRLQSGVENKAKASKNSLTFIWLVFRKSWIFHVNHFLAFFCTGVIFPAMNTAISSVDYVKDDLWYDVLFMPVAIFLNYYVIVLVGRILPKFIKFPPIKHYKWILLITALRFGFIPFFVFCNVQPRSDSLPVVFNHDAYPIIFTSLLGLIHGYYQVLVVQYSAEHAQNDHRELTTMIGLSFTAIGQICGAFVSIPIIDAIAPR